MLRKANHVFFMSFHFFIGIYQYNFLSQNNEAIFAFLLLESRLPFIFFTQFAQFLGLAPMSVAFCPFSVILPVLSLFSLPFCSLQLLKSSKPPAMFEHTVVLQQEPYRSLALELVSCYIFTDRLTLASPKHVRVTGFQAILIYKNKIEIN